MTIKPVHLYQERIQSLLALVITPADTRATLTADCVDLINKYNTGCILSALLKHIAHTRRADTDKHLDKIRTADREKRHLCLTRDCLGQQGLTCTRRANHQHTLWYAATDTLKFLRIFEEINDFADLFLRLVATRDIFKRQRVFIARQHFGFAFTKTHRALARTLQLTYE